MATILTGEQQQEKETALGTGRKQKSSMEVANNFYHYFHNCYKTKRTLAGFQEPTQLDALSLLYGTEGERKVKIVMGPGTDTGISCRLMPEAKYISLGGDSFNPLPIKNRAGW